MNAPSLLTSATYVALLLTIVGLWFGRAVWASLLAVAVVLGYLAGVLYGPAIIWIIALICFCLEYSHARGALSGWRRSALMAICALGILVLGFLLAMHALPGFRNFLAFKDVVLSPGAEPYTMYLNFDKTVVGIAIVGLCYPRLLNRAADWSRALRRGLPITAATLAVLAIAALSMRYLTWQPKWTPLFWIFAANNLFFVCLTEEAVFRGFIQSRIRSAMRRSPAWAAVFSIAVSAVLFGLVHFGGGISYVILATAAGIGYASVYHRTQSIEMSMLTHFLLNSLHFLLFTYPRVAPSIG